MSRLSLSLFGSPESNSISNDRGGTRKAIALLTYLALARQPHSRDALATLLWPEYDQSHAYAALRRTLSALNKALGGYGLAIEREAIELDDQADVWIDAEQFQNRLAECRKHGHAENDMCAQCIEPLTQVIEAVSLRIFWSDSVCATAPPSMIGPSSRPSTFVASWLTRS